MRRAPRCGWRSPTRRRTLGSAGQSSPASSSPRRPDGWTCCARTSSWMTSCAGGASISSPNRPRTARRSRHWRFPVTFAPAITASSWIAPASASACSMLMKNRSCKRRRRGRRLARRSDSSGYRRPAPCNQVAAWTSPSRPPARPRCSWLKSCAFAPPPKAISCGSPDADRIPTRRRGSPMRSRSDSSRRRRTSSANGSPS